MPTLQQSFQVRGERKPWPCFWFSVHVLRRSILRQVHGSLFGSAVVYKPFFNSCIPAKRSNPKMKLSPACFLVFFLVSSTSTLLTVSACVYCSHPAHPRPVRPRTVKNPPPTAIAPPAVAPPPPVKCSLDILKLGLCLDVLGGLVHVGFVPVESYCCPLLDGLLELEAAACLCTAINLKVLNLNIYIPLALEVLITCGKDPPPGYFCPLRAFAMVRGDKPGRTAEARWRADSSVAVLPSPSAASMPSLQLVPEKISKWDVVGENPLRSHNRCRNSFRRNFIDLHKMMDKEAIEKEKARLKDELSRGYFADIYEIVKIVASTHLQIAPANKTIIPAIAAVKFPDMEVKFSDGSSLTLPLSELNVTEGISEIIPLASLLCLSFRASSQRMVESWITPFLNTFNASTAVRVYEVSFIDSWLLSMSPFKNIFLKISKSSSNPRHRLAYSFGDHYDLRKKLQILNLLTGYIFLLDKQGRIRWQGFGSATPEEVSSLISSREEKTMDAEMPSLKYELTEINVGDTNNNDPLLALKKKTDEEEEVVFTMEQGIN
ncbi:hypothetical protein HPP92_015112 [Vanilla planifolia]|uniref:Bifunctional inhibitor/plant lipid transfer protein/seed storage helical domain-containing protein n=1 Tax=Vanilla planifolia TaxID=51239 RepID=A0A835QH90_VANPL|nr:hypothetical protein HPP92_015112 [Vanilla planifolia]